MKKTTSRLISLGSALAAALLLSTGAQAASTWQFTGANGGAATTSYTGLTISGVYAANDTSDGNGFANNAKWNSGTLMYYSNNGTSYGLGMSSDGSTAPNHAIDNSGADTEGVLLSFTQATALTSIGLGYVSGDADISLFRYTGTDPNGPSLVGAGASLSTMISNGWSLVGNYADLTTDTTNPYNLVNNAKSNGDPNGAGDAGADSVSSSWWLVTAYNSAYGTTSSNGGTLGQGNDYFKVYAVAGTATSTGCTKNCGGTTGGKVPEPGSLALASLALVGVFFSRRKTQSTRQR